MCQGTTFRCCETARLLQSSVPEAPYVSGQGTVLAHRTTVKTTNNTRYSKKITVVVHIVVELPHESNQYGAGCIMIGLKFRDRNVRKYCDEHTPSFPCDNLQGKLNLD